MWNSKGFTSKIGFQSYSGKWLRGILWEANLNYSLVSHKLYLICSHVVADFCLWNYPTYSSIVSSKRCSLSQDRLVSFCIKTASLLISGERENVHSDYLVRSKNYLYKILALRAVNTAELLRSSHNWDGALSQNVYMWTPRRLWALQMRYCSSEKDREEIIN